MLSKYNRPQLQVLSARLAEKRRFIQVLTGPRQVGKTTLLTQYLNGLKSIPGSYGSTDGVQNPNAAWIEQQWETARLTLKSSGASELVLVLDEVQKVPNWSETVKAQWDSDTRKRIPIKAVISGSSRLLLQQGLTESLAGRFETIHMGHWSFSEMRSAFGWSAYQYAWFGGYPGAAELINDEPRWKRYITDSLIETSISRDILMLTRVDKPALMRRLFELGCLYSGQILSFTKMLGQLHDAGNTVTLAHYLELLDTAGLLGGLQKYASGAARRRSSSPKFMVHNTALLSAQMAESFDECRKAPEKWGRIVESAIGAHLLNSAHDSAFSVGYWQHGNDEMDFVMSRKGQVIGLEVKSGRLGKLTGVGPFKKRFPEAKVLIAGENGLPWYKLLEMDPGQLF